MAYRRFAVSDNWDGNKNNSWIEKAGQPSTDTIMYSLLNFSVDGKLYGGSYINGNLYQWNDVSAWVSKAPKLLAETGIYSLAEFSGKIYGGTNVNGKLYEWDGAAAWVLKAAKLGAETGIYCLCMHGGQLYGGTYPNANLFLWNGAAWVSKAGKPGAETTIRSLCSFGGHLYGGGGTLGKLYVWDDVSAWVEVAPALNGQTIIYSLYVYNGELYGGTGATGRLFKWNGSNAWIEVAPQATAVYIYSLIAFSSKLYGVGSGVLQEWNGTDAWIIRAPLLSEVSCYGLAVHSSALYCGMGAHAKLYKWGYAYTNGDGAVIDGGAIATVNSDMRWAQAAGVTGALTLTNGKLLLDGTEVWQVDFDARTGNIPALAAYSALRTLANPNACSIGGVICGEFLGIWTALGVAPSAAGGAIPAAGFLKLRWKTGVINDNDVITLPGGATVTVASATGGVRSWIHCVGQETTDLAIARFGTWKVTGDWFYLPDTTGIRGQTLTLPVNDKISGVWIEDSPGAGTYEFFPTVGDRWSATYLGTDGRDKFVDNSTTGIIRIGADAGAVPVGYLPVAGCKVRIPNVILSSSTAADWTANTISTTLVDRWGVGASQVGIIDLDKVCGSFYLCVSQAYSLVTNYVSFLELIYLSEIAQPISVNETHTGVSTVGNGYLVFSVLFHGGTVTNCKGVRRDIPTTASWALYIAYCYGVTFRNVWGIIISKSVSTYSLYSSNNSDCLFENMHAYGGYWYLGSSTRCTLRNTTVVSCLVGGTISTYTDYGITCFGSVDNLIDGLSFGGYTDVHPYTAVMYISTGSGTVVRNIGTAATPLNLGSVALTRCGYPIYLSPSTNVTLMRIERCYFELTRSGLFYGDNSMVGVVLQNVWGDYADTMGFGPQNQQCRGLRCGSGTPGTSFVAIYGNHFWDAFTSATTGRIGIFFTEKTTTEPSASSYALTGGAPVFDLVGGLLLRAVGDQITYTWPWFILGYHSFTNLAPTTTGTNTANLTYEYCIDKTGAGYGAWQTLDAAHLVAEGALSPTVGFKMQVRITCAVASLSNVITGLYWQGDTTLLEQQAAQYPIYDYELVLEDLIVGSTVKVYRTSDNTLLDSQVVATTTYTYQYLLSDPVDVVNIKIYKAGYLISRFDSTSLISGGLTFPVTQLWDRWQHP